MRQTGLCIIEIACDLQVHPELGRRVEDTAKEDCRLSCHITLGIDERVDTLDGNPHLPGKLELCHLQGKKKLREENPTRMCWPSLLWDHGLCSQ
jgi:hypothetical protein